MRPSWDLLRLSVCGVLLGYVWRVQDLYPILATAKFSALVLVAAVGLLLAAGPPNGVWRRFRHPCVKLAAFIAALMVLSVPASLWPGLSFRFITSDHVKTLLMVALVIASVRAFVDVERLAMVTLGGAALFSALTLTRFGVGMGGRLGNLVYYDANDLGMLLVCSLPLTLYFVRCGRGLVVRLGGGFAAWLFLMTIVRTGSRGAFVGLLLVALYLLFSFSAVRTSVRLAWSTAIVAGFVAVGDPAYWSSMQTLLNPKADYNWSGQSDAGRMEVWKRGMGYMLRRPLTGVGVQAFGVAEGTISPLAGRQDLGIGVKWSAAHNSFVQIAAELGLGGIVAFVALLVAAWRALRRIDRPRRGRAPPGRPEATMAQALRAGLVGYMAAGFFLSQAYSAYLYALIGMIVGFASVAGPVVVPAAGAPASGRGRRGLQDV